MWGSIGGFSKKLLWYLWSGGKFLSLDYSCLQVYNVMKGTSWNTIPCQSCAGIPKEFCQI